jgi:predicted AlkP superfamily pyrophosphatase or phosphodiesterase
MPRRLLIAAVVLAAFAVSPVLGQAKPQYKTRNVMVVVMDGVRYSETFGEPNRASIPNLAALEKDGTLYTNYRIAGPGVSVTRQGHSTISTGTWQTVAL